MTTGSPTPAQPAAGDLGQVEIFRPGRHVSVDGREVDFSAADLAAIARSYDPARHEAPHVIGHPTMDAPAWGWVRSLGVNARGRLVADSRQVAAAFAELVAGGRYKKVSSAFYPPAHPGNPTPGKWYLKHVGWLGATPPAVKGLADTQVKAYGEAEEGIVEFADWDGQVNAGLWRRMRDWMIGRFGLDEVDKVLPSWDIDALARAALEEDDDEAADTAAAAPALMYAEPASAGAAAAATADTRTHTTTAAAAAQGDTRMPMTAEQLAAREAALATDRAALDAREARVQASEAAQAERAAAAHSAGLAQFAEGLISEGRVLPAEREQLLAALGGFAPDAQPVAFGEGDGRRELTPLAALQAFLQALPPRVEFAERAGAGRAAAPVDASDAMAITKAAQEYQFAERQAGREVTWVDAVSHVSREAQAAA